MPKTILFHFLLFSSGKENVTKPCNNSRWVVQRSYEKIISQSNCYYYYVFITSGGDALREENLITFNN